MTGQPVKLQHREYGAINKSHVTGDVISKRSIAMDVLGYPGEAAAYAVLFAETVGFVGFPRVTEAYSKLGGFFMVRLGSRVN